MKTVSRILDLAEGDQVLLRVTHGGAKVIVRPEVEGAVDVALLCAERLPVVVDVRQLTLPAVDRPVATERVARMKSEPPPAPLAPDWYAGPEGAPGPVQAPVAPAPAPEPPAPSPEPAQALPVAVVGPLVPERPAAPDYGLALDDDSPPEATPRAPSDVLITWCLKDSVARDAAKLGGWELATGAKIDPAFPWTVPVPDDHYALDHAADRREDIATSKTLAVMNLDDAKPYDCTFCGLAISRAQALRSPGGSCGCVPKGAPRDLGEPLTHVVSLSVQAYEDMPAKYRKQLDRPIPDRRLLWKTTHERTGFDAGLMEAKLTAEEHAALVALVKKNQRGFLALKFTPIPSKTPAPMPEGLDRFDGFGGAVVPWFKRPEPEPDALVQKGVRTVRAFCVLTSSGWRYEPQGELETPKAWNERYQATLIDPSVLRVRRYTSRGACLADSFDVFPPGTTKPSSEVAEPEAPAPVENSPVSEPVPEKPAPARTTTPKPYRRQSHPDADKRTKHGAVTVVYHKRRDGWHKASRTAKETAPEWDARVATLTKGADLVRIYDRGERCTYDSRDKDAET